jgi:predicted DsbA family dithiol-disulfide isomerase
LPFSLHPEYPAEGIPRQELYAKYGGDAHRQRMEAMFASRGLPYVVHPEIVSNTQAALRVGELARDRGLHRAYHDRIMAALWAEGEDVSPPETLRRLAVEAGLDGEEIDEALATGAYADRVEQSTRQAIGVGANAVPAFVLGRRLLVLGAQPEEVLEQALAQIGYAPVAD